MNQLHENVSFSTQTEMTTKPLVTLIPWDPHSPAHRRCLLDQRDECGWDQDKVEHIWKENQIKGTKCIYWIETELIDTAISINGRARVGSNQKFNPIGHISLDSQNPGVEKVGLDLPDEGIFWIKTFFIKRSSQSNGVGRVAMDEVESMATREPLMATTLMLDVIPKEDAMKEDFAMANHGCLPKFSTEEWYLRRGYKPLRTVEDYYDVVDRSGRKWVVKTVFMKKDIL
ncbi:Acyl-CoA N-acyltransferase [Penicillium macrosclerotiorum]|uniref:Acyl-CoA N-acyltransferase n=1 Tax=Penicillium macrosclerotiorum TaxID=303699 RepID=UPI002547309A|nr:Acyl-CoA N-acyltransferase [Penicillium macrosclerotiorum]KAJ5664656.1 Acyl-CoA N-acyltransferase [Penicillium macrosclerotiorum]